MNFNSILNQYGLAGLVIATLTSVVVVLWRQNQSLQKQLLDYAIQDAVAAKAARDQITNTMAATAQALQIVATKVTNVQKRGS